MRKMLRILALVAIAVTAPLSAQTASDDKRDNFPPIFTVSPKGVNIQTGRFTYSKTDIGIGPLSFTRTYGGARVASFDAEGNAFPNVRNGWAHNYANGTYYTTQGTNGSQAVLHFSVPGRVYTFLVSATNPITIQIPENDSLGASFTQTGDDLNLQTRDGDAFYFYKHPWLKQTSSAPAPFYQLLRRAEYADGSAIDYVYNSRAQLRQMISNRGYALVFDYNGLNQLAAVCGYNQSVTVVTTSTSCAGAALKTSYEYNGSGLLSRVIDVSGDVVNYSYTSSNLLACVSLANAATCEISNDSYGPLPGEPVNAGIKPDQVRRQTTANGNVWTYNYDPNNIYDGEQTPTPRTPRYTYATMGDPAGSGTSITYKNGFVERVEASDGVYSYEFNGSVPTKITYTEGNYDVFVRDDYQNLLQKTINPKPGSPLPARRISQTFPAIPTSFPPVGCAAASIKLCTKPITRIDERGNQSDFTYAPEHGGVLTETGPAVNGVRPQTRYSYAQRYAWIKDAGGAFVRAASPVWLLIAKSYCKTGSASGAGCAIAGDEVRTTYDYGPDSGPNNLLLRGTVEDAGGLALRSCYGYDWRGNKISETGPRAGLGVCP